MGKTELFNTRLSWNYLNMRASGMVVTIEFSQM